jgi:hypothetical protein
LSRARRIYALALAAALLAGCASAAPAPPPDRLAPTACEKRALMTGQAPDPSRVEVVAEGMRWGLLAPESCPDAGGRLDGGGPIQP